MMFSGSSADGVVLFGVVLSGVVALRLIKRDFSPTSRCYPHGLPFPHELMSHRGGSLECVENTLPAFRHSVQLGVDLLEMDVQETRDGKVVIFHDQSLMRLCGVEGSIEDYLYEELPSLCVPDSLCSVVDVASNPDSIRIPLLVEVLREFPDYPMQIDVKNGSEDLVKLVGEMILKYDRAHITVWGSFVPRVNQICYDNFGTTIPLFFCARRAWLAWALYHMNLLWIYPLRESALIIPNFPVFLSQGFIRAMNEKGVSVIMFGIPSGALNSTECWQQAKNIGANGICTDKPSTLQEWLTRFPLQRVSEWNTKNRSDKRYDDTATDIPCEIKNLKM